MSLRRTTRPFCVLMTRSLNSFVVCICPIVQTDERLRRMLEHFLYDVIARSALHAQSLIGPIVEHVLGRLTDEQLNHLVYDKVEPDLLWIRMNGSIVGALIGLLLFMVLHFAQLY